MEEDFPIGAFNRRYCEMISIGDENSGFTSRRFRTRIVATIAYIPPWGKTSTEIDMALRRPPGPEPHFLIGNLAMLDPSPLTTTRRWAEQYGDIFYYRAGWV